MKKLSPLFLAITLFASGFAAPPQGGIPAEEITWPLRVTPMYSAWRGFKPGKAAIRPAGYRKGGGPSAGMVRKQIRDIIRHLGEDATLLVQYDPASKNQIRNLDRNFWPNLELFPDISVAVLLETFYSSGYVGDEVGGDISTRTSIDMDDPRNEVAFFEAVNSVVRVVRKKAEKNYLHYRGRPCVFPWNLTGLKGDMARILKIVRDQYGFCVIGGELAHRPTDSFFPEEIERIKLYDGVYFYLPYDGGKEPTYRLMTVGGEGGKGGFISNVVEWREFLDEISVSPRGELERKLVIASYSPAFDDSRLRGEKNPARLPESRWDNQIFLHQLKNLWCGGIIDGSGFINDEPYEAAGNVRNTGHVRPWLEGLKAWKLIGKNYMRHGCPSS